MVLGTCTIWMRPDDRSSSLSAENAVSSPPMVTSRMIPSPVKADRTLSRCLAFLVGFAREVPKYDPPWK
ncbi:MAG: hypothetical protein EWM72_02147 [Nitrospira sp.]|nr:MAG: hypothetical protein EWM72_02147 [Nitrospira sp.]